MSPKPYFPFFALALGAGLLVAGAAGLIVVAIVGTILNTVIWGALRVAYDRRRRAWPAETAGRDLARTETALATRKQLDTLVDRCAIAVSVTGLIALTAGLVIDANPPGMYLGYAAATAILIGTGGVFWSSLIDWFWVLPRVSGLLGHRSCRADPEPGARRESWEEVTRWWLVHRIVAVVAVSAATAGIGGTFAALGARGLDATPAIQAAVGTTTLFIVGVIEIYRKASVAGFLSVLNPQIIVGEGYDDSVEGPCFPVDVAVEGYKVVRRDSQNARYLDHRLHKTSRFLRQKCDATVPLAAVQDRRKGATAVACEGRCLGLSWYCIENPHAWTKGPRETAPTASPDTA